MIVEALRNAGLRIEPHFKWFRGDTPDEMWLPVVGRNNWKVLMRDQRIGTRKVETEALLNSGVQAFVLISGDLKNADNIAIVKKALPKMLAMLAQSDFRSLQRCRGRVPSNFGCFASEAKRRFGRNEKD